VLDRRLEMAHRMLVWSDVVGVNLRELDPNILDDRALAAIRAWSASVAGMRTLGVGDHGLLYDDSCGKVAGLPTGPIKLSHEP
jgi:hypothetical protein